MAPTVERAIDHGVGDQQPDEDATPAGHIDLRSSENHTSSHAV